MGRIWPGDQILTLFASAHTYFAIMWFMGKSKNLSNVIGLSKT